MKYFNIKRYKFSTITRSLGKFTDNILDFLKFINLKKTYKYLQDKIYELIKTFKYLDLRKYNIFNVIKKIKISSNRFLFYHLPFAIVFFFSRGGFQNVI